MSQKRTFKLTPDQAFFKQIILLGGSGFIGRSLQKQLLDKGLKCKSFTSQSLDLLNETSTRNLLGEFDQNDAIVFLSCLTPEHGRDLGILIKNFLMIKNLISVLDKKKIGHLFYVSSDAVFHPSLSPVNESKLPWTDDPYGYMHIGRELMLQRYCQEKNIPLAILRPTAVFGANDKHNSYGPNRFIREAKKDKKIMLFGNGEERRDHIYVEDLTQLIFLCIQNKGEGLLHLATGETISFYELAKIIIELIPDTTIEANERQTEILHKEIDQSLLKSLFPNFQFTKIKDAIQKELPLY